ncbi:tetratricopeptide repeat protein [Candidatus Latescibacterota bacterium]
MTWLDDGGQRRLRAVAVWAILICGGMALFANAMDNPFHYDDLHSIKFNPHIRSLGNVPRYFTDPHTFSSLSAGFMFRPLLLISYALNYAAGGQDPTGYRWVNLLLHIGCAGLCLRLARQVTGDLATSVLAGGLFLVHPAHAEVVNYISARSDVLSAVLYLATVICCARGTRGRQVAGWATYAAGLMVKSVTVTAPLLLSVWDAVRQSGLTAVGLARRYAALWASAALYGLILYTNGFLQASASKAPRGPIDHWWTQLKALVYYPYIFAMPAHLTVEHPLAETSFPSGLAPVLAGAVLATVTVVVMRCRVKVLVLGWSWYLIALLPVTVVPLNILAAERRAYLASTGLIIGAAWAGQTLWRRRPQVAVVLASACLVCLARLTYQRNEVWATETGVWEEAVTRSPGSARAHLNLALALKRSGDLEAARPHLEAGLHLKPDYADAWVVLGDIHSSQGQVDQALTAYQRALQHDPGLAGVHHNLGNVHMHRGDFGLAARYYQQALERNPYFAEARNNLGQALEGVGDLKGAAAEYRRAVADSLYWTNTDDPVGGAWYNLGRVLEKLDRTSQAREAYVQAARQLGELPAYEAFAEEARRSAARLGKVGGG